MTASSTLTHSSTVSTQGTPIPASQKRTQKIRQLSHISAATWIGVGLALGALVVAVFYGVLMWRLASWTALNDFREACMAERENALDLSAACNETLSGPPSRPPVVKRAVEDLRGARERDALAWVTMLAIPVVTLIFYKVWMKTAVEDRPRPFDSMARSCELTSGVTSGDCGVAEEGENRSVSEYLHESEAHTGSSELSMAILMGHDTDQDDYPPVTLVKGPSPSASHLHSHGGELGSSSPTWDDHSPNFGSDSSLYSELTPGRTKKLDALHQAVLQRRASDFDVPIDHEPIFLQGPLSEFVPLDGFKIDMREVRDCTHHLRAVKLRVIRGGYMLKQRNLLSRIELFGLAPEDPGYYSASNPGQEGPLYLDFVPRRAVWARRLGLRNLRFVYLILDPVAVRLMMEHRTRGGGVLQKTRYEWEDDVSFVMPTLLPNCL